MIRIDAAWLATAPLDLRAGTDTALARVITVFGAVGLALRELEPNTPGVRRGRAVLKVQVN